MTITDGIIHGVENNSKNVGKLLGVHDAEPPVGDLRWRHGIPLTKGFGNLTHRISEDD